MRLSMTEKEIMTVIWEKGGPVTSQDILNLSKSRGWKAPTVLSFLKRLCEKGFLETSKAGKIRVYTPIISRKEYVKEATNNLISELYYGKASDLVACLTEQGSLSQQDREELKRLLDGEWE